jgi:hypothetical protein
MKFPKFSLPFLGRKKTKKTHEIFNIKPKPEGTMLIGNFKTYKPDKDVLNTIPLFAFEISGETLMALKGYAIYSSVQLPPSFVKGIEFLKPPVIDLKIFQIENEEEIKPNPLPKVGENEQRGAKKILEYFVNHLSGIDFACEKEIAKYTNDTGKWWLKVKIFKDFGGYELYFKAREQAMRKGVELDLAGLNYAVIDKLKDIELF